MLPQASFVMFKLSAQPCSVCLDDESFCNSTAVPTFHKIAKEDSAHHGPKNSV